MSGLALPVCLSSFNDLCVGARRSFALCVGARRAVCRARRSSCQDPARGPALFVSGAGALCVGARRSLNRAPALSVRVCGARTVYRSSALFALSPGSLCVGPRRSVSAFVSGPGGPRLCRRLFLWGFGGLYVGARRSSCRGSALSVGPRRSLRRGTALCVGARRSLCRSLSRVGVGARQSSPKTLFVTSGRSVCRGPALCVSGPGAFSISGSGALCQGVCGARIVSVSELGPSGLSVPGPALSDGLSVCCQASAVSMSARRSVSGSIRPSGPPAPIRVPPIRHHEPAPPASHAPHTAAQPARSIYPGENPKPYRFGG